MIKKAPYYYLTLFLVVCSTVLGSAQFTSNEETRLVVVNQEDKNIHADILKEDFFFIPESDITYYCYYQGNINSIQGSYTGLLLTGFYEEFSFDQKLLVQGHFYYGMKHGRWKEWHESGKLKKIQFWDKGKMSGAFQEFDQEGKEIKNGNYKDNKIAGKVNILKDGKVKEEKYFKDGKEIEKQELSAIFKKKDREEKSSSQNKNSRARTPKSPKKQKDKKKKDIPFKKDKKSKKQQSPSKTKKDRGARARSTKYFSRRFPF